MVKLFCWASFFLVVMLMFGCSHNGVQLVEWAGFAARTTGSDLCVAAK